MIKINKSETKTAELFCRKYWNNVKNQVHKIPSVSRFDFNDASYEIMCLDNVYQSMGTLGKLIKKNDLVQKLSEKPVTKDVVLYRGISEPVIFNTNTNYIKSLFNKCINLKKGNTLYMPEYSFWSESKSVAFQYKQSPQQEQRGILYELNVPKGFKLYHKIYPILRRYSKFLCTDNKKIINNNSQYNHIKLTLLPRDI